MRIGRHSLLGAPAERQAPKDVDRFAACLPCGGCDRGLEPVTEVEDEAGGLDAADGAGVSSRSCGSAPGGEVLDVIPGPAMLLAA